MISNAEPLRIAVVGAGLIGRRHAELIRASDACRLAALVDPAPASEELAREHDVPHFSPLIARARETIASGRLGRIVAVHGTAMFRKPDRYFDEAPWRRQPGGGPILINLIHEIDGLRTLCGEITGVQAFASNTARGFEVEDTVAIGLRFASGALGTFLLSDAAACAKSWEQTSGENSSYASYPDEDCYLVAGTQGSLAVPTLKFKSYAGERSWWKPFHEEQIAVDRDDPLERQLAHFCAVIRREATPLCTVRDALETLRVTLAVAQAAAAGCPIRTDTTADAAFARSTA